MNPAKAWISLIVCAVIATYVGFVMVPGCLAANEIRQKEAAKEAVEIEARGPKPVPDAWDGVCPQVRKHMERTLMDAGSLEIVESSPVVPYGDDAWAQRVRYRAKNGFGALIIAENVFVIRDDEVIDVLKY